MDDSSQPPDISPDELFERVTRVVTALVGRTGGNVEIVLVDDANPSLLFRISVDGVEWTRAEWTSESTLGITNAPVFLERCNAARAEMEAARG